MIDITRLVVGPLDTNCYIVRDVNEKACVIVDPGGDKDRILKTVESLGALVERILLTHGHPDHTFCAGALAADLDVKVGMHPSDVVQDEAAFQIVALYYDVSQYVPLKRCHLLVDGDEIALGGSKIRVMHTPGHSEGGVCFVTEAGVLCGDSIFAGSIGRTDFPGGSLDTLLRSIREKILPLPDDTPLYPGHGPATTVGAEREHNPFLK
jgi:hydroxyacylglutathione hydrolase